MILFATVLLGAALTTSPATPSGHDGLSQVNAALQAGEADEALSLLASLPQPDANSAQAHNFRCRVLFALEQWDAAGNECQQAVNIDGQNSLYHLWLGRTLGEQADHASFVTAYNLAKRARAEFERSVELDPRNAEALADLGEFYSEAPGVVGGGSAKAESVAARLDHIDPARAHELRSAIARESHDYADAERELRQAISLSPHPALQWMRLASFYRKAKRFNEMDASLQSGIAAASRDQHAAVALYNGASVLIAAGRNSPLAARLLEQYLASTSATEEGPTFIAHVWLARLKSQMGDADGARREKAAALALAQGYKPAQDLKL